MNGSVYTRSQERHFMTPGLAKTTGLASVRREILLTILACVLAFGTILALNAVGQGALLSPSPTLTVE